MTTKKNDYIYKVLLFMLFVKKLLLILFVVKVWVVITSLFKASKSNRKKSNKIDGD